MNFLHDIFWNHFDKILNWFDSIWINERLWSDAWIPDEVDLNHTEKSLEKLSKVQKSLNGEQNQIIKFDVEKIRAAKTVGSDEVESIPLPTVNEEENDPRSKRSKKKPTRYLNYELD